MDKHPQSACMCREARHCVRVGTGSPMPGEGMKCCQHELVSLRSESWWGGQCQRQGRPQNLGPWHQNVYCGPWGALVATGPCPDSRLMLSEMPSPTPGREWKLSLKVSRTTKSYFLNQDMTLIGYLESLFFLAISWLTDKSARLTLEANIISYD